MKYLKQFKLFIRRQLGIIALQNCIHLLESERASMLSEFNLMRSHLKEISEDNHYIRQQIRLINKDFTVAADISPAKHDPSVVMVIRERNGQSIVKYYDFSDRDIQTINEFLKGFGGSKFHYDAPIGIKSPRFRY